MSIHNSELGKPKFGGTPVTYPVFYGAASSIQKDLSEFYRTTETNLESLSIWSTRYCEVVVIILDYEAMHRPMVGTIIRLWQRFVEEGSNLYYWKEVDVDPHWEHETTDLMKSFDEKNLKWVKRLSQ